MVRRPPYLLLVRKPVTIPLLILVFFIIESVGKFLFLLIRCAGRLIQLVEEKLSVPVMLVARDEAVWAGARVHANFEAEPYLYALLEAREIEWAELGLILEEAA